MQDNFTSRVPGELSLKVLVLTSIAFFAADFAIYRAFSRLFPPAIPQQPAAQSSFDQKIGNLQKQLAIVEQRLSTLDAEIIAIKAMPIKTRHGRTSASNANVPPQELEKLKSEIRQLEQKCPCKP